MDERSLSHLWDRIEHLRELQHFALRLLNADGGGLGLLLVGLRANESDMAKIASSLSSVGSVYAAKGSVRLIQALLLATTRDDQHLEGATNQDWRWEHAQDLIRAFPCWATRVGQFNEQALRDGDASVLVAVSSLRWCMILLLMRIEVDGFTPSDARTTLHRLLSQLDNAHSSLELQSLSCDNPGGTVDGVSIVGDGACLGLAARNVFTLLLGVEACGWQGDWRDPDVPYINRKVDASIWSCPVSSLPGPLERRWPR